jgi:hypothetical protein
MARSSLITLIEFLQKLDGAPAERPSLARGDVLSDEVLGIEVAAVLLRSELLYEDRLSRMNKFWDLIVHRDVLLVALGKS